MSEDRPIHSSEEIPLPLIAFSGITKIYGGGQAAMAAVEMANLYRVVEGGAVEEGGRAGKKRRGSRG
mgnify:CR=1 FL=1